MPARLPMTWTRRSEHPATAPALLYAKALELLARREHSRLELRQKLLQRGFVAADIDPVLNRLVAEGSLDEGRYAELYACTRADKGYGPLRIAQDLRARGVPDEHVTAALAALEADWPAKLRALHRKRFQSRIPADVAGRLQQTRFLRQQGFSLEQIKALFEHSHCDS